MKKIVIVFISILSFSSIAYGAEKELNRKGSANPEKSSRPGTPKPHRILPKSPHTPRTPTLSPQNSPKQGRPSTALAGSGGDTPKKKVKSIQELRGELKKKNSASEEFPADEKK